MHKTLPGNQTTNAVRNFGFSNVLLCQGYDPDFRSQIYSHDVPATGIANAISTTVLSPLAKA
jgi:hypothetical protein